MLVKNGETNLKRNIELIAQREKLGFSYNKNNGEFSLGSLPSSMDEARAYSNFWKEFILENSDKVKEVTFNYQEKSKEIPLTNFQKLRNYFGGNIKPKEIEGEVKNYTSKTVLVSGEKGLANIITNKKEFEELVNLSKTTNDFATNYVFSLEPLCHRTIVPLELITKMKLEERK